MAVDKQDYFDQLEKMSLKAREKYQNERLSKVISYVYAHAPAVKLIMDQAHVLPSDIRKVEDLQKIPITRKSDLIQMQKISPPYGGFLMIPPDEVERVFISPGPIYEPLHTASIKWFAKAFYTAGFRKGDTVVNTFTYHMSPAGILFHEGLRDCGATVVVMGTGNTDILVKTMYDLKVTGFVGTPSFLATVIKRAEEMGYTFKRDFLLKRAWFTGEMLPPSTRSMLEGKYEIATFQSYAVTEPGGAIAYECKEKNGMHLMDEYIVEIVDPTTGNPLMPGEVGEVVVTPVQNKTWGLIRFGTGDLSSLIADPCYCGRTSYRLAGLAGRTTDAVKVRGMFIVAKQAEQAIMSFAQVSRFQLVVGRTGERDEVTLKLELKDDKVDKNNLAEGINKKFQEVCRLKLDMVKYVATGSIPEQAPKISDERKWE